MAGTLRKLLSLAVLAGSALFCRDALTQPSPTRVPEGAEQILALTNQARAADGLGPLKWNRALAEAAQAHADRMAEQGELSHQFPGEPEIAVRAAQAGARFRAVAENIALGPSVAILQSEWMHSVQHRENILDPRMDAIGIAVVRRGGELYAVEDFAHVVESMSPREIEQHVAGLLEQQGVRVSGPSRDARQTCEMSHGFAGATQPGFVMRWESSEMNRLPDPLLERIRTRQYRTAEVGACGSAHPGQPFTTYHVAVLLY